VRVLIIGAAGMLGRKLAQAVAARGVAGRAVTHLDLADMIAPPVPAGFAGQARVLAVDIAAPGTAAALVADRPQVIFHLAAIVSGEAEADFDKGYAVNLDATRWLFEAVRAVGGGYCPRDDCRTYLLGPTSTFDARGNRLERELQQGLGVDVVVVAEPGRFHVAGTAIERRARAAVLSYGAVHQGAAPVGKVEHPRGQGICRRVLRLSLAGLG
jgi:nucleoside-diphosphate-sugar epimerase